MVHNMKGSITWGKNKVRGISFGRINLVMGERFMRIIYTEKGYTSGQTGENIMVNGKITKWMEQVSLNEPRHWSENQDIGWLF